MREHRSGIRDHLPSDGLPVQRGAGERTRELDWGANAIALIVAGVISDQLRVRKPFMLVGGIGSAIMLWIWLLQAGQHPSFATLVLISCLQTVFGGFAFVT